MLANDAITKSRPGTAQAQAQVMKLIRVASRQRVAFHSEVVCSVRQSVGMAVLAVPTSSRFEFTSASITCASALPLGLELMARQSSHMKIQKSQHIHITLI